MHRPRLALSIVVLMLGSACVFDSERRPLVDVNVAAASSYVFRGQTFDERPVAQFDTSLQLPTKDGGRVLLSGFGNLDLTDSVGQAWSDGGHQGEFTQLDVVAGYGRKLGDVDVLAGLRYYSWPNGEAFPFAPFPSTSEAFARVGGELFGLGAAVDAHYDIDEVHSLYLRGELSHELSLADDLALEVMAWLGWSDADHSLWLYRRSTAAFADLGASLALRLALDELTSARFAISGSSIVDSELRGWFDTRVDPDVVWFTASIGWAF